METGIKISVVVPTYKRPALLKRCLDALFRQQYPADDFEIIIVADGPDETTQQLVKVEFSKHPGHFARLYSLKEKRGNRRFRP